MKSVSGIIWKGFAFPTFVGSELFLILYLFNSAPTGRFKVAMLFSSTRTLGDRSLLFVFIDLRSSLLKDLKILQKYFSAFITITDVLFVS